MANDTNIEMVKAVYVPINTARHSLYGGSRTLGRPINYGYRKQGDVFNVAVADVLLAPHLFIAYPCRKPFIIRGNSVEVPCGEMEPVEQVGTIEGLPGIGKKTAEKLAAMGILTPEDVLNNVDEEILNGLPPRGRKAIKEWQEQQKS